MILFHRPGIGGNVPSGRTLIRRALRGKPSGGNTARRRRSARKAGSWTPRPQPPMLLVPLPGQEYRSRPGQHQMWAMPVAVGATTVDAELTSMGPGGFPVSLGQHTWQIAEFNRLFH